MPTGLTVTLFLGHNPHTGLRVTRALGNGVRMFSESTPQTLERNDRRDHSAIHNNVSSKLQGLRV
jgi:hypothetical protein